jgi:hypothetical protein
MNLYPYNFRKSLPLCHAMELVAGSLAICGLTRTVACVVVLSSIPFTNRYNHKVITASSHQQIAKCRIQTEKETTTGISR